MALPYPQSQLSMSQNTVNYPQWSPARQQPQVSYLNGSTAGNPVSSLSNPQFSPMRQYSTLPQSGSVLGAGTSAYSGRGNTGNPGQNNNNNIPMESVPGQPSFDEYDAAIQQGISALDQYANTLQPEYDTAVSEFTNQAGQQKTQARSEEGRRLNALGENRMESTQQGESAISAARRQAAQLMQGLQSMYGGTTGTGAFKSEILGSQAMQNISGNQQAMQTTLGKIAQAENDVRGQTTNILKQIDDSLTTQKEKARNGLQQALSQIASQKAELASSKAQMRIQALQNYQNLVADINARNTQFKQQLYAKAQSAQDQINTFKNNALQYFNTDYTGFDGSGMQSGGGIGQGGNTLGSQSGVWTMDDETGTLQTPQVDWNSIDFNNL